MKMSDLKQRVALISRRVIEDEEGNFQEEFSDIGSAWARLTLMRGGTGRDINDWGILAVNAERNYYRLVMQKNYNRNALHAELYGLRFRGRVLKLMSPIDMITDNSFVEAVVVDAGQKDEG